MDTAPQQPKHPVHALTTYELSGYRRELEHALKRLPEHAEVRTLISQKLDEVLREQDSRARVRGTSGQA
jgi:hypothetical protein